MKPFRFVLVQGALLLTLVQPASSNLKDLEEVKNRVKDFLRVDGKACALPKVLNEHHEKLRNLLTDLLLVDHEISSIPGFERCGKSTKSILVRKKLKGMYRWLGKHCPSTDIDRILSTVKTYASLYLNANCILSLPEASLPSLEEQVEKLWPTLDSLNAPFPENESPTQAEKRMNNLNRHLFLKFDTIVNQKMNTEGTKIDCAHPVVEWAENVIPKFDLDGIGASKDEPEFKEKVLKYLKTHYKAENLKNYLADSWVKFVTNIKLNGDIDKHSQLFCENLSNTMCYVARKSLPVSSTVLKRPSLNQKLSWADLVDGAQLMNHYDNYGTNRCNEIMNRPETSGKPDSSDFDYFGCRNLKMNFCFNFWEDLAKDYVKEMADQVSPPTLDRMKKDQYHEVIQEFKNSRMVMGEEVICE